MEADKTVKGDVKKTIFPFLKKHLRHLSYERVFILAIDANKKKCLI